MASDDRSEAEVPAAARPTKRQMDFLADLCAKKGFAPGEVCLRIKLVIAGKAKPMRLWNKWDVSKMIDWLVDRIDVAAAYGDLDPAADVGDEWD